VSELSERWVAELISAVQEHEDTHAPGYRHPGSSDEVSNCLFGALMKVPSCMRDWAAGWKEGYAACEQDHAAINVREPS
jgi:hypothetical protein